jgi:hypothetical protein
MARTAASLPKFPSFLVALFIPLLILLPVLWALLPGGLPNSADGMVHFTRITEIVSSWRDGVLLPRWSLNLGFGYGIPVFVFGPPLSYWMGALYNLLGFGPEAAYKAMLVTILFIGATGAYRLGQVLMGIWAGAVMATAIVYAPNQLFTLFVQGNAPQLLAWSFLPWALWATIQIFRAPRQREQMLYALALALVVSGTLMSHNVVSLIMVPTVGVLALSLWIATRRQRALWITAGGGVLGAMMGAWFAVPALLETVYASTDAIVASDYHGRFVPLLELLSWPLPLDAGAINPYIPRTLGMPILILALIGLIFLLGWLLMRRTPAFEESADPALDARLFWATAIFMTLYAFFCGLMALEWSEPIWETLPLLKFFQFPARWIGFAGFGLAWLAAAVVGTIARRRQPFLAGITCLFLITSALVNLYPDKTPPGTRTMSPYDVVRYELRSGAIGTTSYGEFNPRWAPRPLPPSPMVEDYMARQPVDRLKGMLPEGANHQILEVNAHHQRYQITLPAAATISINLLYFPGWQATVNGAPAQIWPQEGTGLITLALPAGESIVGFTFGPTSLRRATGLLSMAAWAFLGVAFVLVRPVPASPQARTTETGKAFAIIGAVVAIVLIVQNVGAKWFHLRSPADQVLAAPIQRHDDVGERFRLLGQNELPTTIRAGNSLPVVAYWRSLTDEMDENYSVVLRLEDVNSGQILVEAEQAHPNDIPTSGWATGLYVRNEWNLPTPADALPMQYVLRIGFRDPATSELLPTAQGNALELGRLWVLPEEEPEPATEPHVRFGPDIELPTVELLGARTEDGALTLYWRANIAVSDDYTIFVHLLDANGELLGQLDGLPFDNRYPIWAWRLGQIIEDKRDVAATGLDQIHAIAVGFYDPATDQRLAATDEQGNTLPNNAVIIPWSEK